MNTIQVFALATLCVVATKALGGAETTEELKQILTQNPSGIVLPSSAVVTNEVFVMEMRRYRQTASGVEKATMTVALLDVGDTNTLYEVLATYRSGAKGRMAVGRLLEYTKHPAPISLLSNELETEESAVPEIIGGEMAVLRPSVDAARIMRSILIRSEAFPSRRR